MQERTHEGAVVHQVARAAGGTAGGVRVAVVHDYLTQRGGAERVVLAMLRALPEARLITSVYDPATTFEEFRHHDVETTWLQRFRPLRRDPRRALPLLAPIFSQLRVDDVDVVVCSSSGWAHGVRTTAPKIVYCYNPPRWIYQHRDYVASQPLPVRAAFAALRPSLRTWDQRAARSADTYLTSSTVVRRRIQTTYSIEAELLPPPVTISPQGDATPVAGLAAGYFLLVGRARGYKNVDVACEAFAAMPDQRLVVVGDLPAGRAWPRNVRGMRDVTDAQLRWLYGNCEAVIATANEDFGLTPLEGNSFGRPALVLRAGGFLDTLDEGVSGLYIERLDVDAIKETVRTALDREFNSHAIRAHADLYSEQSFAQQLQRHVASAVTSTS